MAGTPHTRVYVNGSSSVKSDNENTSHEHSSSVVETQKHDHDAAKDICITDYSSHISSPSTSEVPSVKAVRVSKKDVLANIQRLDAKGGKPKSAKKVKSKPKAKTETSTVAISPFEGVRQTLLSWWTIETFEHLHGVAAMGDMTKAEFEMRYAQLGRRVDKMTDIDDVLQAEEEDETNKPSLSK